MSQVSSVDSFLHCLGLIFLKARKEMSSQMQETGSLCALAFRAQKKSTLDNGMRVLNRVGWYLPKKKKKLLKSWLILAAFCNVNMSASKGCHLRRLWVEEASVQFQMSAYVTGCDWWSFFKMTCVLTTWRRLEAPLCETTAAGVTVRGWGRPSSGFCPIVEGEEDIRQRQTEERVNNAVRHGKTKRIGDCTACLHADLSFAVRRESLCDV